MTDTKELLERLRSRWTNSDEIRLHLGECTPQELRSIKAVAISILGELSPAIERLEASNAALMAERTNLIETKRQQIERLEAERDEALKHVELLQDKFNAPRECACAYDSPHDVCMHHSPMLVRAEAQRDQLAEALRQISSIDAVEAALDPEWAITRARTALASLGDTQEPTAGGAPASGDGVVSQGTGGGHAAP